MSIAKAQAAALADGFIQSLGTGDKGDFVPKNTLTELFLLAGELVDSAQKNLNSSNKNSSGKLSESLIVDEPVQNGKVVRADILMNFYGRFVNKGVKGLRGGSSLANYSFKTPYPSANMVKAIAEWAGRGKLKNVATKKYKAHGKHDVKNRSIENANAYAVAYSVKQKGLKPTGFLDKAVATTESKVGDRLGAALKIDVINSLEGF
jgi:hypothetical protein